MVQEKIRDKRSLRRERVGVLVLVLFPLLVAGGFFTPGWVRLMAVAQPVEREARDFVRDRVGTYGHRPLSAQRDLFEGSTAVLLDLDQLFDTADYSAETMLERRGRVAAFGRSYGQWIVLDDLGQQPQEIAFKDALRGEIWAQVAAVIDGPTTLLILCRPSHGTNCVTPDGIEGSVNTAALVEPTVVPEPNTAFLLALGLLSFAVAGRRTA